MPAKQSDRTICFVNGCPYPRKVKGLCSTHYIQHQKGLWNTEVALFELESTYQAPKMGYYSYKARLKTLAKSIPVSEKDQRKLVRVLLAAYRGGSE